MRGGESGASIVQVCVPEFQSVDFRVVKKRRCVVGIVGGFLVFLFVLHEI